MEGLKYIIILYGNFLNFLLTGTFHSKRYDNSLIRKNAFNLTDLLVILKYFLNLYLLYV